MDDLTVVPAIRAHFRFQWEPAQDCYVLLYPEGMVKLNGSAGEILACVDGERSVAQIIEKLSAKFPEGGEQIAADTLEFLEVALERQWIEYR